MAAAVDRHDVPVLVLGKGSNILVADAGFAGLVVSLAGGFDEIVIEGSTVRAGGAVQLPRPGPAQRVGRADRAGMGGRRPRLGGRSHPDECRWSRVGHGARPPRMPGGRPADGRDHGRPRIRSGLCLPALAHLPLRGGGGGRPSGSRPGDPERSLAEIAEIVRWRREHQPGGSNAGSVFTNPVDDSAGRLIEEAGLKGHRIGSAEVSPKHANFIQADAGGSADDVRRLIEDVRQRVRERFGVDLRTEVQMIGFDDRRRRSGPRRDAAAPRWRDPGKGRPDPGSIRAFANAGSPWPATRVGDGCGSCWPG